jgi:hypothetical protein
MGRPPDKRKPPMGGGADADNKDNQPPKSIEHIDDEGDGLGFFRKALSGKVRPAPREPQTTHYGCSCCRWRHERRRTRRRPG